MRNFAKRLMASEAMADGSSGTDIPAAFRSAEKLRTHLATLMGTGGFRALLARALALASAEVPWLRTVHVKGDGSLEGPAALHEEVDPGEELEGSIVLLAQLLGLLVAFIGPNLTVRLMGEAWPQALLDDLDFGQGGKNEKAK
jgi:hypothetical protein